ncbi:hypothetical protein pb186bvf_008547 [Paramecium bursaria]
MLKVSEENKLLSEIEADPQPSNSTYNPLLFLFLGISSLVGWSATLSSIPYFQKQYPNYSIEFYLPIPYFVAGIIVGFSMPKASLFISQDLRIIVSLLIQIFSLIALTILGKYQGDSCNFLFIKKTIIKDFILLMIDSFFIGLSSTILQSSGLGLASKTDKRNISLFSIGTALSGLSIAALRVILEQYVEDKYDSILIYLNISNFLNVLTLIIYFYYMRKLKVLRKTEQFGVCQTFYNTTKKAFPIPLLIFINYLQTFMLFPGLSLQYKFDENLEKLGGVLLLLDFSIGDLIGKTLAGFVKTQTQERIIGLIIIRFAFYFNFIQLALGNFDNDWIAFTNMFLFSFLNGYITTSLYILGPQKISNIGLDEQKYNQEIEKVGFVSGFSLFAGIMIGSFLSLSFQNVKQD